VGGGVELIYNDYTQICAATRKKDHVRWVPCHHGMTRPQVADGGKEGLQIQRVAANTLNKQSRTADKGWSSSLGVRRRANNPHRKKSNLLRNVSKRLGLVLIV
jgi:hypothetical protein